MRHSYHRDLNFSDQLFNPDTIVHKVIYHFIPRISPIDGESDCENGKDTTITIWVNPIPRITVSIPDTIFCNNEITDFTVDDGLGNVMGDKKVCGECHLHPCKFNCVLKSFRDL